MGKVSQEVRERYNAKTYDRATVRFKKGNLEIIKSYCDEQNKSFNSYINDLIKNDMAAHGKKLN